MSKLMGRTDDMLIIRGVNVFPSQVEEVLLAIEGASPYYLLVVDRVNNLDTLEVRVEMAEGFPFDEVRRVEALERHIAKEVLSILQLSAKITIVPHGAIDRALIMPDQGKAKKVLDKRG
jgi:phenylacetate-CoA ligase